MEQLPFKVRKKKPEIIYVTKDTKLPRAVEEDRMGADALNYRGKIYFFRKKVPPDTVEHEKSHVELGETEPNSPKGVIAWLDDEVKADIYTYHKIGKPERINDRLQARAYDVRIYHMTGDTKGWYNYYEQSRHALEHVERAYRKYWDYLPEQWKKDYLKFIEQGYKRLERFKVEGKSNNPPKDYHLWLTKSGFYALKKKRTLRKRDKITGFMMKEVR